MGNKCTYADLAFVPWYWLLPALEHLVPGFKAEVEKENPNWVAWMERLSARPAVIKSHEAREKAMAQ